MNRVSIFTVALLFASAALRANEVTVGTLGLYSTAGSNAQRVVSGGATFIDLTNTASSDGDLTSATVRFQGDLCEGKTFTLRFYRNNAPRVMLVAERGPYPITGGVLQTVTLSPPVTVLKGDMIGVTTTVNLGHCDLDASYDTAQVGVVSYGPDFPQDGGVLTRGRSFLRASSSPLAFVGVLPAVGTTAGANGSLFRTDFSVTNVSTIAKSEVKFVFHPIGRAAQADDPSFTVVLKPRETRTPDLLAAMNVTGLGSIDVFSNGPAPEVVARVYNDTGSGTNGFTLSLAPPSAFLQLFDQVFLAFPADFSRFRMNVGVRNIGSGGRLFCGVNAADGTFRKEVDRLYDGGELELTSLSAFVQDDSAIEAGGSMVCQGYGGMLVFSTTTDNLTNDSTVNVPSHR